MKKLATLLVLFSLGLFSVGTIAGCGGDKDSGKADGGTTSGEHEAGGGTTSGEHEAGGGTTTDGS